MRVFLDTNVLAAALGTRGLCADLLAAVIEDHEPIICNALLTELRRVLAEKFNLPPDLVSGYIGLLEARGRHAEEFGTDQAGWRSRIPDPDDVPLIAAALEGQVQYFVTGDKALLGVSRVSDLPIISPRQLWDLQQA
mgnify:CR=1 FL=1